MKVYNKDQEINDKAEYKHLGTSVIGAIMIVEQL